MKTLALLIATLLSFTARAQPAVTGTFAAPGFGRGGRVVSAPDGGWLLVGLDSLRLARFAPCGRVSWRRTYRLPGRPARYISNLCDVIALRQGGFAVLTRTASDTAAAVVLRLDAAGTVVWSRTYSNAAHRLYPYTLSEDQQGNLVLFANVAAIAQSTTANLVSKLHGPTGNVLWSRLYDLGVIWGGAIVTADQGVLFRTGNRFVKLDAAGDVQWACFVMPSSANAYFAPVEVSDGYVFTSDEGGARQISFYKIDKQGRLRWGGRKLTSLRGQQPFLRALPNDQIAAFFNETVGGRAYPTVVAFDRDLVPQRQGALSPPNQRLAVTDLALTPGGGAILTGGAAPDVPGQFFFARTDSLFRPTCDTTLPAPVIRPDAATQQFISVQTAPFALTTAAHQPQVGTFALTQQFICTQPRALALGPDTVVCAGSTLTLQNQRGAAFDAYRWSTGATTPTLAVNQTGTYWVRAYFNCGLDSLTDTLRVTVAPLPAPAPAADTLLCDNATVALDATVAGPATYRWSDGSTAPRLVTAAPGNYFVDITTAACAQRVYYRVGECEQLLMPNIFTPTADDFNERLLPIKIRGIGAAALEVYNRWGRRVFATDDLRRGWDGHAAAPGTYFWLVRYAPLRGQPKTAKGWVELVRP